MDLSRRSLLAGGGVVAVGGALGLLGACATTANPMQHSEMFKSVDASLSTAVETGTVLGVVALGSKSDGPVYEPRAERSGYPAATRFAPSFGRFRCQRSAASASGQAPDHCPQSAYSYFRLHIRKLE